MSVPIYEVAWEPSPRGVELDLRQEDKGLLFDLDIRLVRELRDDMEEAVFLARGFEKLEVMLDEVMPGDQIRVLGDTYTVQNILSHGDVDWVLQFEPNSWHDGHFEITLPRDKQVTIYRYVSA